MFRILFLILIWMSQAAYAQIHTKPESRKFDEFGIVSKGDTEMRLIGFIDVLKKEPTAQGYIINYGGNNEVTASEQTIRNWFSAYKIDASRITLLKGGFLKERKTQFWIVPAGAEPPEIIPLPYKIDEFGKATNGYVKMIMDAFFTELNNNPTSQGYIVNYGTDREIAKREKQIRNSINFRRYDSSRITLVRGGNEKIIRTQFWIVPAGAENPALK